jgi:hypothetical protein
VLISGILFPYGQEVMEAALAAGQAISYRCVRQDGVWYVHATTERPEVERVTCRQAGALGVNLTPDRVAVGEVDRFGTPVPSGTSPSRCRAGGSSRCWLRWGMWWRISWPGPRGPVNRWWRSAWTSWPRRAAAGSVGSLRPGTVALCVCRLPRPAGVAGGPGGRGGPRGQSNVHQRDGECQVYGPGRAVAARGIGGGDCPAGSEVWGAAEVRRRPSPTREESGKARLERLGPSPPPPAWAEADARRVPASLRGRPRRGGNPSPFWHRRV